MEAPIQQPAGEGTASPGGAKSEAEPARTLVERMHAAGRRSAAEVLHELRRAFPDAPLEIRVRALEALRIV